MFHPIFLLLGFWYVLPAYVANGFAVFASLIKSKHPIDGGRQWRDEQPILGLGKTWEGLLIGFLSGFLIGCLLVITAPILFNIINLYLYLPLELYPIVLLSFPLVAMIALGALIGDLIGSFIKRRLKIPRGRPAPILDQLDFLIAAILFGMLLVPLPLAIILFLLIITPIIHLLANVIGYLLRLKKEPW